MPKIVKSDILKVLRDRVDAMQDSGIVLPNMQEKMSGGGVLMDALYYATLSFASLPDPSRLEYLKEEHDATPPDSNPIVAPGVREIDLPAERHKDRQDGGVLYVLTDGVRRSPVFHRTFDQFVGLVGSLYSEDHGDHTISLVDGRLYALKDTPIKIGYVTTPPLIEGQDEILIDTRYRNELVEMTVSILLNRFARPGSFGAREQKEEEKDG